MTHSFYPIHLMIIFFTYSNVTRTQVPLVPSGILSRQKNSDKSRIIHSEKQFLRLFGIGDEMEHSDALSTLHLSIHSHWAIILEGENANPMQWWLINLPVSCLPPNVTSSKCGTIYPHRFRSSILDIHRDFILNPRWFRSSLDHWFQCN